MMREVSILCILLCFAVQLHEAQRIKECKAGEKCILFQNCPKVLELFELPGTENGRIIRGFICDFKKRKALVCCPSEETENNAPSSRRELLPKFCGYQLTLGKIRGGTKAQIGAYPWVAALGYTVPGIDGYQIGCGGSVINSRYILTAAHCLNRADLGRRRLSVIKLGARDISLNEDCKQLRMRRKCYPHLVAGIEETILHPQYNQRALSSDDIALIRLNITIDFLNTKVVVGPVCLPSSSFDLDNVIRNRRRPIAAGWGASENVTISDILLNIDLPLVANERCIKLYGSRFVGKQLCAGGEKGMDTCLGDSGGPLVLSAERGPPFIQIGIVSFGPDPCGIKRLSSVYTSVSDYMNWIANNLKP